MYELEVTPAEAEPRSPSCVTRTRAAGIGNSSPYNFWNRSAPYTAFEPAINFFGLAHVRGRREDARQRGRSAVPA